MSSNATLLLGNGPPSTEDSKRGYRPRVIHQRILREEPEVHRWKDPTEDHLRTLRDVVKTPERCPMYSLSEGESPGLGPAPLAVRSRISLRCGRDLAEGEDAIPLNEPDSQRIYGPEDGLPVLSHGLESMCISITVGGFWVNVSGPDVYNNHHALPSDRSPPSPLCPSPKG
jgi:hypothetical protein